MARTNKYNSLNFNEIYEKKFTNNNNNNNFNNGSFSTTTTTTSSSSSNNVNKTMISNSRIHGHMLVLSRPTPKPKPISIPQKQQQQQQPQLREEGHHVLQEKQQPISSTPPDRTGSEPGLISLRPQGRTGPGPGLSYSSPLASPGGPSSPLASPLKTDKFVPPHLRPGFVGREERPGPGPGGRVVANREFGGQRQGHFGSSPNRYGEDGRPKSGGGYERMRRGGVGGGFIGGEADPVQFMSRPASSGARPSSSG